MRKLMARKIFNVSSFPLFKNLMVNKESQVPSLICKDKQVIQRIFNTHYATLGKKNLH